MRLLLLASAVFFASSAWSLDLYTPAAPAADTQLDPQCNTRNELLNKAPDVDPDLSDACKAQVKKSAEACAKDPDVSADDLKDAHDAAAPGGENASYTSYSKIHTLKQQKYSQRSDLCKNEEDKIKDVCNQSNSDLRKQMAENPNDSHGNAQRAKQVSGNLRGAKEAMKVLDMAASCDSANANIERDGAAQAQVQADHISQGGAAPSGPGTERPDPIAYENGKSPDDGTSAASPSGSSAVKQTAEKGGKLVSVAAETESVVAAASKVSKAAPGIGGIYAAAVDGDRFGGVSGLAEGGLSLAGYTTAATVAAAPYAVYQGFWGFGGANMGTDDTPWTQWNATHAANIMNP